MWGRRRKETTEEREQSARATEVTLRQAEYLVNVLRSNLEDLADVITELHEPPPKKGNAA